MLKGFVQVFLPSFGCCATAIVTAATVIAAPSTFRRLFHYFFLFLEGWILKIEAWFCSYGLLRTQRSIEKIESKKKAKKPRRWPWRIESVKRGW
ncbi:hypothetical protein K1719_038570 [Acacia pycnantha]|nr:hypothetical protein K1719_038570 [Acacia pycnantha]